MAPEPKTTNRIHLDLQIADATEAAQEIKRLREFGGRVLVDQHDDAGLPLCGAC